MWDPSVRETFLSIVHHSLHLFFGFRLSSLSGLGFCFFSWQVVTIHSMSNSSILVTIIRTSDCAAKGFLHDVCIENVMIHLAPFDHFVALRAAELRIRIGRRVLNDILLNSHRSSWCFRAGRFWNSHYPTVLKSGDGKMLISVEIQESLNVAKRGNFGRNEFREWSWNWHSKK